MAYDIRQIAEDYKAICDQLPDLISKAGFRQNEVYVFLGLSRTAWTHRLKNKTWTPDQLIKIANLLEPTTKNV